MQRCKVQGTEFFCLSPAEARLLYEDLFGAQTYFSHGVVVKDGDCVFDVGANIGLFALQVHRMAPKARIFAFEPIPPIREVLAANVELFGIDAKIFPVGLSRSNGTATFTFYPSNAALSGTYADPAEDKALAKSILLSKQPQLAKVVDGLLEGKFEGVPYPCELRTLSSVVKDEKIAAIDLLKIDVEKGELDVIDGIDEADWPKIRQIVAEVHDIDGRLALLTGRFERHGFRVTSKQHEAFQGTGIYDVYALR